MREMKYRAWDGEQFLYLDLNNVEPDINIEWLLMFFRLPKQQYTGIKDKNGKEIYEGDIIKREAVNKYACGGGKYIIKWNEGYAMLGISLGNNHFPTDSHNRFYKIIPKKVKVIGNIFENPELMELL